MLEKIGAEDETGLCTKLYKKYNGMFYNSRRLILTTFLCISIIKYIQIFRRYFYYEYSDSESDRRSF